MKIETKRSHHQSEYTNNVLLIDDEVAIKFIHTNTNLFTIGEQLDEYAEHGLKEWLPFTQFIEATLNDLEYKYDATELYKLVMKIAKK